MDFIDFEATHLDKKNRRKFRVSLTKEQREFRSRSRKGRVKLPILSVLSTILEEDESSDDEVVCDSDEEQCQHLNQYNWICDNKFMVTSCETCGVLCQRLLGFSEYMKIARL